MYLWRGRDSGVAITASHAISQSDGAYAQTVVGGNSMQNSPEMGEDHKITCDNCSQVCCVSSIHAFSSLNIFPSSSRSQEYAISVHIAPPIHLRIIWYACIFPLIAVQLKYQPFVVLEV